MTVISSQKFRDEEIIESKIEALEEMGATKVVIPVVNAYTQDFDGNNLFIVIDHHHTMTAALKLKLEIEFEEVEDIISGSITVANKDGETVMREHYMDSPYYYVDVDCENGIGADVF